MIEEKLEAAFFENFNIPSEYCRFNSADGNFYNWEQNEDGNDKYNIPNNFNKIIDDTKVKISKGEIFMFDQDLNLRYGNALAPLVDAVKKGYTSYSDLEHETGQNNKVLSVNFANLASSLIRQHLVKGHQDKTRKQIVIDFIQSRLLDNNYTEIGNTKLQTKTNKTLDQVQGDKSNKTEQELKERCNNFLEKLEQSQKENQKLRKRIDELENQPRYNFDFDKIRHKIQNEIDQLSAKLQALDLLEAEF